MSSVESSDYYDSDHGWETGDIVFGAETVEEGVIFETVAPQGSEIVDECAEIDIQRAIDIDLYSLSGTPDEIISYIQNLVKEHPGTEHYISMSTWGEQLEVVLHVKTPETNKERERRLKKAAKAKQAKAEQKEKAKERLLAEAKKLGLTVVDKN